MQRTLIAVLFLLSAVFLLVHCRAEEPALTSSDTDAGHATQHSPAQIPTQLASSTQDYTTNILLLPGCDPDGRIAVAKQHVSASPCEEIAVDAVHMSSSNIASIEANFDWSVSDSAVAVMNCSNNLHGNSCAPVGLRDLFDGDNATEPRTAARVCVTNDCPSPKQNNCPESLCLLVPVDVVVNLEGTWSLVSTSFPQNALVKLTQDGRHFYDFSNGVKNGQVRGADLSFHIDDYLYSGTIAPDRSSIYGTIWELLGDSPIGTWQATRSP
jgi:hypothetical protein